MAMASPQNAATNWARGMANSTEKIKQGVMGGTESPTAKAAARADAYLAGVQRAVSERRYQAALEAVSTEQWKQAMLNKGVNRIAGGAEAAKGDFANFMGEFLPFVAQVVQGLPPRGTTEQNIERAVQTMRGISRFRRRGAA